MQRRSNLNIQDVRKIASKQGLKEVKLMNGNLSDISKNAEGNSECFATPYVRACGQMKCLWREDCLNGAPSRTRSNAVYNNNDRTDRDVFSIFLPVTKTGGHRQVC